MDSRSQGEPLPDDFAKLIQEATESSDHWEPCLNKNGVTVEKKKVAGFRLKQVRCTTEMKVPVESLFSTVYNVYNRPKFDDYCSKIRQVEKFSEAEDCISWILKMPIPFEPREVCMRRTAYMRETDGVYMLYMRDSTHPKVKPRSGVVRAQFTLYGYLMKRLSPTTCSFTVVVNSDPMGNLPKNVLLTMQGKQAFALVTKMTRVVEKMHAAGGLVAPSEILKNTLANGVPYGEDSGSRRSSDGPSDTVVVQGKANRGCNFASPGVFFNHIMHQPFMFGSEDGRVSKTLLAELEAELAGEGHVEYRRGKQRLDGLVVEKATVNLGDQVNECLCKQMRISYAIDGMSPEEVFSRIYDVEKSGTWDSTVSDGCVLKHGPAGGEDIVQWKIKTPRGLKSRVVVAARQVQVEELGRYTILMQSVGPGVGSYQGQHNASESVRANYPLVGYVIENNKEKEGGTLLRAVYRLDCTSLKSKIMSRGFFSGKAVAKTFKGFSRMKEDSDNRSKLTFMQLHRIVYKGDGSAAVPSQMASSSKGKGAQKR